MREIFPDRKLENIPVGDPLLSTTYGGSDLRQVSRHEPSSQAAGGRLEASALKKGAPVLKGVKFGDRWGVIFSPYDLSCALENRIRSNAAATSAKTLPRSD